MDPRTKIVAKWAAKSIGRRRFDIPELLDALDETPHEVVIENRIPGGYDHILYTEVQWKDEYGLDSRTEIRADISNAQVVSSELADYLGRKNGLHAPVLDIDMPAFLVPSSTPGHSHLYIDRAMTWRQYKRLLKTMASVGVLEKGYVKASLARGHSDVRVPWLKKG